MAEFVQTMKDWRRMCSVCTCSNKEEMKDFPLCPIITQHIGYPCDECPQDWSEEATKQFEEIVTAWAAEHPEQVYPTWIHWLKQQGVIGEKTMQGRIGGIAATIIVFNQIAYEPIPADIAQKIGITPKGEA